MVSLRRPLCFFSRRYGYHRALTSFPTRRSSDLRSVERIDATVGRHTAQPRPVPCAATTSENVRSPSSRTSRYRAARDIAKCSQDRKSTRLNSSHVEISYAVFCLKKKKTLEADE